MQDAMERITKSLALYRAGTQSKTVTAIELVSAFKVICRNVGLDSTDLEHPVHIYVASVLEHIDDGRLTDVQAVEELRSVYERAHLKDPAAVSLMINYQ